MWFYVNKTPKPCQICTAEFVATSAVQKYCKPCGDALRCQSKHKREGIINKLKEDAGV